MSSEEIFKKFEEMGYDVVDLGNDKCEISCNFDPTNNGSNLRIKTIFNLKNKLPESSQLFKDDNLISEHLLRTINGNKKSYTKIYGKSNLREQKNTIIIR